MKNTIKLFATLAVLILALTACSGSDNAEPTKTIDIGKTMDNIVSAVKFDDELIKLTEKNVSDYYEFDDKLISEYQIRVSATGATTEELAIFKLATNDTATSDAVEKLIEKRMASLTKSFVDYIPAEAARIENALISKKDGYILFCISNNNDTVETTFGEAFK